MYLSSIIDVGIVTFDSFVEMLLFFMTTSKCFPSIWHLYFQVPTPNWWNSSRIWQYVVLLWILRDLVLYLFSVALFLWANFRTLLYSWDSYQLVDSKIAFLPCLSGTLGTQYWSYYLGFCMLSYNFGEFCLLLNYNLNTLWHPNFACIL